VPLEKLLSIPYAQSLCARIDPRRASATVPGGNFSGAGDTIVLSTADRWGNMVSWVNSNFDGFGSGITVPGYGFVLHNRGALFSLDPASPNALAPHKRPFNTLSAAFVMQEGKPLMALQLMGGDMQAQGHMQVLVDILDLGANIQAAGDMARFRHNQIANALTMESQLFNAVGAQLKALGHQVSASNRGPMGGYQAIYFVEDPTAPAQTPDPQAPVNGYYRAGSDFGKDGQAVGW
jgi:gamma-glutamyltranspeptidase/glutathione hydrolase